jgi:small nuclear ribonucleoprotein (snRNP)-like protein
MERRFAVCHLTARSIISPACAFLQDAELEAELRAARRAKAAAMKQRAANTVTRAAASVRLGSLTDIMTAATFSGGPIAALARWQAEGARVTAVTRHAGGVRGRAVGRLIAFDRFLNLLMADVEESYAVMTHVRRVRPQAQKLLTQAAENLPQQQQEGEEAQQQQQQQQQNSASTHCRPGAQQRVRWCRKLEQRQRSLEQVLLVGDSIVLVSCRDGKG